MEKINFNADWFFTKKIGGSLVSALSDGDKIRKVILPHDASIEEERCAEESNGSGNGYFHEDNYQYTKLFELTSGQADCNIYFEFEGIYQNAFVYINGSFVRKHAYGYGNFFIDATRYIHFDSKNEIKIIVKNALPSGRWYTGGGIYRNVWMMCANRIHLSPNGIHIQTDQIENNLANLTVESQIQANRNSTHRISLCFKLFDHNNKVVTEDTKNITVFEHTEQIYRQRVVVENPSLWDTDHPYLYHYEITISENDTVVDKEVGNFGIRTLMLDKKYGLRVNGKTVKLKGGCIHHDNGIIGAAEFHHAEERRIRMLKECGYNAVRSAHYPISRTLLDVCDRLGMMVMDEYTDVWTMTKVDFDYGINATEDWEEDITNMVNKDYNHPSVVLYSIGNEISETGNAIDVQWGKKFADLIHRLDQKRFVTNCLNPTLCVKPKIKQILTEYKEQNSNMLNDMEINSLMSNLGEMMKIVVNHDIVSQAIDEATGQVDVIGYNYAASRYILDAKQNPGRIIIGSESFPGDLDFNWKLVEKYPQILGDFSWTAWDYLGEAGIGQVTYGDYKLSGLYAGYPYKSAYCGDIDLNGNREPISFWRESIWKGSDKPYIAVQPPAYFGEEKHKSNWKMTDAQRSWNWEGYEGKHVIIEVYSDTDEVKLYKNGIYLGSQKPISFSKMDQFAPLEPNSIKYNLVCFETTYESGILEAIAYRNGQEVGRDQIETVGRVTCIQALADCDRVPKDGTDIVYIEILLVDSKGNVNPIANNCIEIVIDGPGVIQGFGSAAPTSLENYFDHSAKAYHGKLLAAIRGNGESGTIHVTFKSAELPDTVVKINAI